MKCSTTIESIASYKGGEEASRVQPSGRQSVGNDTEDKSFKWKWGASLWEGDIVYSCVRAQGVHQRTG